MSSEHPKSIGAFNRQTVVDSKTSSAESCDWFASPPRDRVWSDRTNPGRASAGVVTAHSHNAAIAGSGREMLLVLEQAIWPACRFTRLSILVAFHKLPHGGTLPAL